MLEISSLTVSRVQFVQVYPLSERIWCEWAQFIEQFNYALHDRLPLQSQFHHSTATSRAGTEKELDRRLPLVGENYPY